MMKILFKKQSPKSRSNCSMREIINAIKLRSHFKKSWLLIMFNNKMCVEYVFCTLQLSSQPSNSTNKQTKTSKSLFSIWFHIVDKKKFKLVIITKMKICSSNSQLYYRWPMLLFVCCCFFLCRNIVANECCELDKRFCNRAHTLYCANALFSL